MTPFTFKPEIAKSGRGGRTTDGDQSAGSKAISDLAGVTKLGHLFAVPPKPCQEQRSTMTDLRYLLLDDRGVLAIAGADARNFLQGLVSNNVERVSADRAIYAAFLTPQGKYLHDFFIVEWEGALLLDCEADRRADLARRLSVYRLRSKVTITDRSGELAIAAVFGNGAARHVGLAEAAAPGAAIPLAGGVAFMDPRLAEAGVRVLLPRNGADAVLESTGLRRASRDDYERLRIGLGLPDGSRDMPVERALLLECGFDELHGIDWDKGCYLGQELTARTKYRGLVKRRLVPARIHGPLPLPGTPITANGKEVGEIRSGIDGEALALMRLDFLDPAKGGQPTLFLASDTRITPTKPAWAAF